MDINLDLIAWIALVILVVVLLYMQYIGSANADAKIAQLQASLTVVQSNQQATNSRFNSSIAGLQSSIALLGVNQSARDSALSTAVTSAISSEESDITSTFSSSMGTQNSELNTLNANIDQLDANIIAVPKILLNYTNVLQGLYLTNRSIQGRTIIINDSKTTFTSNSYYTATILPGFANRLNYSSNQTVILDVMTLQNYAYFATNHSFSTYLTYTGSQANIWINLTAGCPPFVYAIATGTTTPFTLAKNISAIYTSNEPNQIC